MQIRRLGSLGSCRLLGRGFCLLTAKVQKMIRITNVDGRCSFLKSNPDILCQDLAELNIQNEYGQSLDFSLDRLSEGFH